LIGEVQHQGASETKSKVRKETESQKRDDRKEERKYVRGAKRKGRIIVRGKATVVTQNRQ
jgi:hypothetical protein